MSHKFVVLVDLPRLCDLSMHHRREGRIIRMQKNLINCKYRSRFAMRRDGGCPVLKIFSVVHYLADHSPLGKKWKRAEDRMFDKYIPNLYKMISLDIKKERF